MRASGYERETNDWYCEPRWVVDALLDVEAFQGWSLDPSCGGGNIPKAMLERGMTCFGSDLVDRGYGAAGIDFLSAPAVTVQNVVTNPPYGVIEAYVEKALTVASGKVAILARLALLEGMKRQAFFKRTPLARVWVSSRRVSMPPGGLEIDAKGGSIAFAWFIWEHQHEGPPTLGWL